MKTWVLILLSMAIQCLATQRATALDSNLLPANIPESPQYLLPADKEGHSFLSAAEMANRSNKAKENGWYRLFLQGIVVGVSNVVPTECHESNMTWLNCPNRRDRQSAVGGANH